MDPIVQAAAVAAFSAIFTTFLTLHYRQREKLREAQANAVESEERKRVLEDELSFRAKVLSFALEPWQWVKMHHAVQDLFRETKITRFFILKAYNGVDDPEYATGIHIWMDGGQTVYEYNRYELDDAYKGWLYKIRAGEDVFLIVDELPDTVKLKHDYKQEGVISSLISWLHEKIMSDMETISISYVSYASHKGIITPAEAAMAARVTDMIRDWLEPIAPKEVKNG